MIDKFKEYLQKILSANSLEDYIIALGITIVGILAVRILNRVVDNQFKKLSERTDTNVDDYIVESLNRFGVPLLYLVAVYAGIQYLVLPTQVNWVIEIAAAVVLTFFAIRFIATTILSLLKSYIRSKGGGEEQIKQLRGIMIIVNVIIWSIGILLLLSNYGVDVTAMVTGLGIGGIAIALAAQNILGDLFNYFVIFFDRPFEIGDFLIIDDKLGTVEYIGIKTTRLRSLSGEQLVFANSDLTSSRIHNYKRMQRRRIVFKLGVVYQTPLEQVKQIPGLLKAAVEAENEHEERVLFDRSHFAAYGDSSLNFEVVYIVLSADYNRYMDVQQAINFRVYASFEERGIDFAYPTRTLHIAGGLPKEGEQERLDS